jgi:hypothetical protein
MSINQSNRGDLKMAYAAGGSNFNLTEQSNIGLNAAKGAGVGGPAVNATGRDQIPAAPIDPLSLGASFNAAEQYQSNDNDTDQTGGNAVVAGSDNATSVNVV